MKYIIIICILSVASVSCKEKVREPGGFLLKNPGLISLEVDPVASKKGYLSEYVKNTEYIVLESVEGIQFAEPLKITIYQDNIFCLITI